MSVDAGDILRTILTWVGPGSNTIQNVWHYRVDTGTGLDVALIQAEINTNYTIAFANIDNNVGIGFVGSEWTLQQWDFVNNRWDGIGVIPATGIVGLSVTPVGPQGIAGLGRVITAVARRQGRTFLAGIDELSVAGDDLTTSTEAALAAFMAQFDAPLTIVGGTLSWGTFNTEPLSPLFELFSVASQVVIANTLVGYQRRRKPGVGA